MNKETTVSALGELEIQVQRVFDAPPQMVFRAHTEPQLVRQWLNGPSGWVMKSCEIDLRVGGLQRFVNIHESGQEMGRGGAFQEIIQGRLLVHTEVFDEDWTGGETIVKVEFLPEGTNTKLIQTIRYGSAEARNNALRTGMEQGMSASFRSLDTLLQQQSVTAS